MKTPARDAQKNIRFSTAELATLNTAAVAADQTLAEFVRGAALERAAAQAQRDTMLDLFERLMQDFGDSTGRRLVERIGSAADLAAADALAAVEKRSAAVYERIVDRQHAATKQRMADIEERLDHIDAMLTGLTQGLSALAAPEVQDVTTMPTCPKCGKGRMMPHRGTGQHVGMTFYACSARPACQHTSWRTDGS